MKRKFKSYDLFAACAVLLMALSFFVPEDTFDIHLHDTFFVIPIGQVFRGLAIMAALYWVIYKVNGDIMFASSLTWIHVLSTLAFVVTLAAFSVLNAGRNGPEPGREYNEVIRGDKIKAVLTLTVLASQFLFIINLVIGAVRRAIR